MSKQIYLIFLIIVTFLSSSISQSAPPNNWFNLDPSLDKVNGVSTEQTYLDLLKDKKGKIVVVAILDSGIDADHEDLKKIMWVNPGEIANNGVDDDGNGYTDDVNGWNFIGGSDGTNVHHETYEVTRLYGKDKYRFENAERELLTRKVRKEYDQWLEYKNVVDKERGKAQINYDRIMQSKSIIDNALSAMKEAFGDRLLTPNLIDSLKSTGNPKMMIGINVFNEARNQGVKIATVKDMEDLLKEDLQGGIDHFGNKLEYGYNPDFNSREIVGDDYSNSYERFYGNNDVEGPDAFHGTHVAGIIGAIRHNGIGMNGVANNVALMSVRTVPDGDERDKDVANAIIYAVDNGASVINMSFGKGQSWNKKVVDEAVKYAAKHDVLLVHASGNSHLNIDESNNFPNDTYKKKGLFCGKKEAPNWIEVGAISYKGGENAIANFSNYSKNNVDLFAPGVAIYSTIPNSEYKNSQGTSFASPVVAGVAATLRSYFPSLTAKQVKEIMMQSTVPITQKVLRPGDNAQVSASDISVTGGTVNLYKAIKLAEKTKGKRKQSGSYKSDSYDKAIKDSKSKV